MSVRKEVSSMEEVTCSSGNASEHFMVSNWVPAHVMDGLSSYNVGTSNTSTIEGLRGPPFFGSECLSEIMSSFNLPENTQVTSLLCPQDFPPNNEHTAEKTLKGKKRKKLPDNQNTEAEQEKDVTTETMKSPMEMEMEMVEKKHKNEGNPGGKESSDATKEDYIHVRAKRGQATNSHSLAERVRREKISERMKLLQDLVPGCNKITGKAVMLDEIINYVQSLQRQVEFLSMKLAAVDPELNMDIEQIYTKENYHSRYGASFPETITSHPQLQAGMVIPSLPGNLLRPSSNPQISAMAQISSTWDNDYQNGVQLGFIPNLSHDGMEVNGSMKLEL